MTPHRAPASRRHRDDTAAPREPTAPPAPAPADRPASSPAATRPPGPAAPTPADRPASSPAAERPLRLFVALELPEPVRDALAALAAAADPDVWRPVNRDGIHVTLAFLGARPPADVATIDALLATEAGGAAPPLALAEAEVLPPRRGRVLTARIDDPSGGLAALQSRISAGLEGAGLYTPEKRPFHAHATVARLRPRVRPPRAAGLALEPLAFAPEAVTLYVSRLHPKGARYEPLARAALAR